VPDVKSSLQNAVAHHADKISKLYAFRSIADAHPELNLRAGWIHFDAHGMLRVTLFTEDQRRDQKLFGKLTKYGFCENGDVLVGEGEDYILTLAPLTEGVGVQSQVAQGVANAR
jgi:hypothetical protein